MLEDEPILVHARSAPTPFPQRSRPQSATGTYIWRRPTMSQSISSKELEAIIWVKKTMPDIGLQSFDTARQTIAGFEAMLWLKKGFGFTDHWTVMTRTMCSRASGDFKRSIALEARPIQGQTAGRNLTLRQAFVSSAYPTAISRRPRKPRAPVCWYIQSWDWTGRLRQSLLRRYCRAA
jgi:hypothetical protein